MNELNQRIAIAEACGWNSIGHRQIVDGLGEELLMGCPCKGAGYERLPDYLHDLNACHEMEKSISRQSMEYTIELYNLVGYWHGEKPYEDGHCDADYFKFAHATAAQRCEAFLRTIGKWEEE